MKNKLSDLNNHLFAQMERLSNEDLDGEKLTSEITRAKAVSDIARSIISNATLVLRAQVELGGGNKEAAEQLLLGKQDTKDPGTPQK